MLRKRSAARGNQRGMALVLALMAICFLVALTVQLFSTVNWQMQAAGNMGNSIQLDAMTRSALNLARAALFADQKENTFDSLHDGWHTIDQERIAGIMGTGRLTIAVEDLSGRLQVNALVYSGGGGVRAGRWSGRKARNDPVERPGHFRGWEKSNPCT